MTPAGGRRSPLRERLASEAARQREERYPGELWRELAPRLGEARRGGTRAMGWPATGRWLAAVAASVLLAALAVRELPWLRPLPEGEVASRQALDTPEATQPPAAPDASAKPRPAPEPPWRQPGAEPDREAEVRQGREAAPAEAFAPLRATPGAVADAAPGARSDPRVAFGSLRPPAAGLVPPPPALAPPVVALGRALSLGAATLGKLRSPNASLRE